MIDFELGTIPNMDPNDPPKEKERKDIETMIAMIKHKMDIGEVDSDIDLTSMTYVELKNFFNSVMNNLTSSN